MYSYSVTFRMILFYIKHCPGAVSLYCSVNQRQKAPQKYLINENKCHPICLNSAGQHLSAA